MRARLRIAAFALAGVVAVAPLPAFAAATIYSFTSTGSATLAFAVSDQSQTSMAPTSGSASYSLMVKTSTTPGTVTVTAPTITGSSGVTIPQAGFTAKCTETSDTGNVFTTTGTVRLSSSPVTCGTLAANKTGTVDFTVTLTLDDTSDAYAFPADTYTSGSLKIIANVP